MSKCPGCKEEFGTEVRVELITICDTQRRSPIIGIQYEAEDECLWYIDYEKEDVEDGEIMDEWYACSFCGKVIPRDDVKSIVLSYKTEKKNE